MARTRWWILLLAGGLLGCSSSSNGAHEPGAGGNTETWSDGKQLSGNVVIDAGKTVTIAPGARITFAKGTTVSIEGTLKAASRAKHAVLDGAGWAGLNVDGGALDLDGVDIQNADRALRVGAGTATYQYGAIRASGAFDVQKDGALTVMHASVVGNTGPSPVLGTFTATFLDYDAGPKEGIVAQSPTAILSIEDSHLHGQKAPDNDLIQAEGASRIHVAHVELTQAHCGMHFDSVDAFDVSNVTIHDGAFGMMLYGSNASGDRSVKATNIFKNFGRGIEEGAPDQNQGPITVADGYWADNGNGEPDNIRNLTGKITVTNMSTTTPIADVGPRGPVPW
jgi:hypothetical protein